MIYTTLNKIKSKYPCADGWETILKHINKTEPDDEVLSFKTILESNGILDAIWALRSIEGYDKEIGLFAVACARRVQHLMKDERSINALKVAEKYARGECTKAELDAAAGAAWAAVGYDAGVDAAAAEAAAWAAARSDVWNAAWKAAAWAAEAAAWESAWAARAAREEELNWQTEEFKRVFCAE